MKTAKEIIVELFASSNPDAVSVSLLQKLQEAFEKDNWSRNYLAEVAESARSQLRNFSNEDK